MFSKKNQIVGIYLKALLRSKIRSLRLQGERNGVSGSLM